MPMWPDAERVGQRGHHAVEHLGVAHPGAAAHGRRHVGPAGHHLDAAADAVVAVAEQDVLRGRHDRLQARRAEPVDGHRHRVHRQPGLDRRHPGHVRVARLGRDAVPHRHVVDLVRVDGRAAHRLLHHGAGQVRRLDVGQPTTEAADRRTYGGQHDHVPIAHVESLPSACGRSVSVQHGRTGGAEHAPAARIATPVARHAMSSQPSSAAGEEPGSRHSVHGRRWSRRTKLSDPRRMMADVSALDGFSPATRDWFGGAFVAPTAAQEGAWAAAQAGRHALVVAPTGSGKTLAAFLWALDRLAAEPAPDEPQHRCRVLYVSPLKALAVDVQRNLRSPLAGIRQAADRLGLPVPDITVGMRTGDTPADERRLFARTPPDVLVTTPGVAVPDPHLGGPGVAARGADGDRRRGARGGRDQARRAPGAVAGAARRAARRHRPSGSGCRPPCARSTRCPRSWPAPGRSRWCSRRTPKTIEVSRRGAGAGPRRARRATGPGQHRRGGDRVRGRHRAAAVDLAGGGAAAAGAGPRAPLDHRVRQLAAAGRAADRAAQRAGGRGGRGRSQDLDALPGRGDRAVRDRRRGGGHRGQGPPRLDVPRAAHPGRGGAQGRPAALRGGHLQPGAGDRHGRGRPGGAGRGAAERGVRAAAGRPGRPPGRRGVHRGGVPQVPGRPGVLRGGRRADDRRARSSRCATRATRSTCWPSRSWPCSRWSRGRSTTWPGCVRRAAPFAALPDSALHSVLDMLAGRYPSEEFGELRARITWDRVTDQLAGPAGRAAARGHLRRHHPRPRPVHRDDPGRGRRRRLPGRRAGRGDGLRVAGRRHVPARHLQLAGRGHHARPRDRHPGAGPAGPDAVLEGRVDRAAAGAGPRGGRVRPRDVRAGRRRGAGAGHARPGWTSGPTDNLLAYLREQREATRHVPSDRTILVERFRDELGDWRLVVHSPFGAQVNGPWALAIAARMRERRGVEVHAAGADDGIVLRLPDAVDDAGAEIVPTAEDVLLDPAEVEQIVVAELGSSSLYASRFRECAARALLLPRRDPKRRSPLWQQRQRSAQLLAVAGRYEQFPITLEAMRECVQDVYDLPGLRELMSDVAARAGAGGGGGHAGALAVRAQPAVRLRRDVPLRVRRAAGRAAGGGAVAGLHAAGRAARLGGDPRAARPGGAGRGRGVAAAAGPRPARPRRRGRGRPAAVPRRPDHRRGRRPRGARRSGSPSWSRRGGRSGCGSAARSAGWRSRTPAGCATRWARRCRSGCRRRSPSRCADPLGDLVLRYARTHGPFPAAECAARFGLGVAVVAGVLDRLVGAGRLVRGELRPLGLRRPSRAPPRPADGIEYCDAEVLRRLRRASLARLRAEVEPVEQRALGRFLPGWQGVQTGGRRRPAGPDAPGARGRRTCSGWWSSWPGRRCRPARWSR